MADLMNLEELLNPFQATQNRLKRALAQAQGQPPQPDMADQIPGMQPRGFPQGLPDQIPGNAPQPPLGPQQTPAPPVAAPMQPSAPPGLPDKPKGRVLSRSVAATSNSSDPVGEPSPFTNADKKVPEVPTQRDYWARYDQQQADYLKTLNEPRDYSGYEKVAKQKGDVAGNNLMLALLMQQTSGFEDTGKHLLRQALGAQGPQEFEEGMVDVGGKFVERPGLRQARELRAKEFMLTAEEKRAMREMTADERKATLDAAERRWMAEQAAAERRHRESLGATYAGQNKLQFHKGDNGEIYTFDPRTGAVGRPDLPGGVAGGTPRLPKGASNDEKKSFNEQEAAIAQTQRLQQKLDRLSPAEQGQLGGVNAALEQRIRGWTDNALGNPLYSPTEKVRGVQTDLQREAALLINQLYGAALSKMEAGRAGTFTVMPGDDIATVRRKLNAAVEFANTERGRLLDKYGMGGGAPGASASPRATANDYLNRVP